MEEPVVSAARDVSVGPARCANHPERGDTVTCARCGTFVCPACVAPQLPGHCVPCAQRLDEGRFLRQVPIFGIVMMVHGVLVAGMGIYYVSFGGFFAANLIATAPADDAGSPGADLLSAVMFGVIGLIALSHIAPGALQIWAGWRVRSFRGRALGYAALVVGLVSLIGCYCAPTSIGLLVWGLILLRNEDVVARFAAARRSDT